MLGERAARFALGKGLVMMFGAVLFLNVQREEFLALVHFTAVSL